MDCLVSGCFGTISCQNWVWSIKTTREVFVFVIRIKISFATLINGLVPLLVVIYSACKAKCLELELSSSSSTMVVHK